MLHPANMLSYSIEDLKQKIKDFTGFYSLQNLDSEIEIWYKVWVDKNLTNDELKNLELCDVEKEADTFFPSIERALHIAMALPCMTCTIESSFSTLRRVKTWLRATMIEVRLNGLSLLSVHREVVKENKTYIRRSVKTIRIRSKKASFVASNHNYVLLEFLFCP